MMLSIFFGIILSYSSSFCMHMSNVHQRKVHSQANSQALALALALAPNMKRTLPHEYIRMGHKRVTCTFCCMNSWLLCELAPLALMA
jgi:hypothetical protein